MQKKAIQLRNFTNVAASKTALLDCPCGDRYHTIIIQHGFTGGTNTVAGACSNIAEIRVKVNGRVQRVYSGTQLRDLNLLNGTAFDGTGVPNTAPGVGLSIFFAEPWRRDEADQDALAWPTNGWRSFQIEVDLGAASTPLLAAWAVTDTFQTDKEVQIVKHLRYSIAAAGTSFDWNIPDRRDWLQQISFYPDSGASQAATQVTWRVNGDIKRELTSSANTALLTNFEMTPAASGRTASIYDLVVDHDDLIGSAYPLANTRDVTFQIAAGSAMSGTIVAMVQRLGPLE